MTGFNLLHGDMLTVLAELPAEHYEIATKRLNDAFPLLMSGV